MIKKILIILIEIIFIFSIYSSMFLSNATQFGKDNVTSLYSGDVSQVTDAKTATIDIISAILNTIRVASAGIAVVILIVLACKYMMASAGDRADIKKYAVNYIIGAFIMFGATTITSIIKLFVDDSLKETTGD